MTRAERLAAMRAMYEQGCTLQQISERFGVTRERVRQILRKNGIERSAGGAAARARIRQSRKDAAKQSWSYAKYGCDYETIKRLREIGAVSAFRRQRQSAKNRAIEWRLSLAEWWGLWDVSGKWAERGRSADSYVMSRIKNSGPYAIGNVHIQKARENGREAVEKWRGKKKEFRGVHLMYPGRARAWRATFRRKTVGFYESAEEAALARLSAQLHAEIEGVL